MLNRIWTTFTTGYSRGANLKSIAQLIEEKKVVPLPVEEMPLEDAAMAREKLRSGAAFGKIVLKVEAIASVV